tara:strand:- start:470 stop:772 length:303 start_codon:yes stop_codon:yes gene_type:complete
MNQKVSDLLNDEHYFLVRASKITRDHVEYECPFCCYNGRGVPVPRKGRNAQHTRVVVHRHGNPDHTLESKTHYGMTSHCLVAPNPSPFIIVDKFTPGVLL